MHSLELEICLLQFHMLLIMDVHKLRKIKFSRGHMIQRTWKLSYSAICRLIFASCRIFLFNVQMRKTRISGRRFPTVETLTEHRSIFLAIFSALLWALDLKTSKSLLEYKSWPEISCWYCENDGSSYLQIFTSTTQFIRVWSRYRGWQNAKHRMLAQQYPLSSHTLGMALLGLRHNCRQQLRYYLHGQSNAKLSNRSVMFGTHVYILSVDSSFVYPVWRS